MGKKKKTSNYENCEYRSCGGYCTSWTTCPYRSNGFCCY